VRVALTFDVEHPARPTRPGVEETILAVLSERNVPGTFFLQGRWVRANPDQARRIAAAGHLIGNHSHYHAPMDALTDEGFRADVAEAEETIREITAAEPKPWFRCPFGSGMHDERVLALLDELGYRHVGWDVDPKDWDEARTRDDVVGTVLEGAGGREDSIVLMHGWPAVTGEALPEIVEGLLASGADFVDVGTLADQSTFTRNA
jgi:peptidoglycan/xylan/chitin deacetylase (PgdA/CDA1 family)